VREMQKEREMQMAQKRTKNVEFEIMRFSTHRKGEGDSFASEQLKDFRVSFALPIFLVSMLAETSVNVKTEMPENENVIVGDTPNKTPNEKNNRNQNEARRMGEKEKDEKRLDEINTPSAGKQSQEHIKRVAVRLTKNGRYNNIIRK